MSSIASSWSSSATFFNMSQIVFVKRVMAFLEDQSQPLPSLLSVDGVTDSSKIFHAPGEALRQALRRRRALYAGVWIRLNDGVMIYHCWALRWTTVTDSQRSSSYLLALLWRPCSPDRVVLEGGPPSSVSSSIVDWTPGHKHNSILILGNFSI